MACKWKLGARSDYDFAYGINDFYPAEVSQQPTAPTLNCVKTTWTSALATWISVSANNMSYGAKWSACSLPTSSPHVTPRIHLCLSSTRCASRNGLRRPSTSTDDLHAEVLWIPVASYDNIGKPGAGFFPYQPVPTGFNVRYPPEARPERNADNMNYGLRLSTLKNGWDVSGFYYRSSDISQTFYRNFELATNTFVYQARHDRIHQYGGTISKDFGDIVFKAEGVYTRGRSFTTLDFTDSDGVVQPKHPGLGRRSGLHTTCGNPLQRASFPAAIHQSRHQQ